MKKSHSYFPATLTKRQFFLTEIGEDFNCKNLWFIKKVM